jgi:predicted RNA binding protein YcfA (HicA-like mRNA interferase family)
VKLPRDLSGADVVKALRRLGFEFSRQTGSHVILRKGSRTVVVPQHKPVKPGTLKGVIEQAGLTVQEFGQML